ncbi:MAG: hypothetical protein P8074_03415 [Anaerolineales bacterium]
MRLVGLQSRLQPVYMRVLDNGRRTRRAYWSQPASKDLKDGDVQLAAPEGFSAYRPDPAHTHPGFAGSSGWAYSFPSMPL